MSETTTDTSTVEGEDEGTVTYEEEGDNWVQIDTRGGQETRTVMSKVERVHPNKPEDWEPSEEDKVPLAPGDAAVVAQLTGEGTSTSDTTSTETTTEGAAERPPGNASRETWVAYAESQGVTVAPTATRDEIIAAVDAAG